MKILALEFSSEQRSVAVVNATPDGAFVVGEAVETGAGAAQPISMVERALREVKLEREQIECVAVGLGPGSYTGVRAAIAIAQGWQLTRDVRLLGISSADAIAAQAQADGMVGRISVIIDAQREEIYMADYEIGRDHWRVIHPLRLTIPAEATEVQKTGSVLIGPEITRWYPGCKVIYPRAAVVGRLAAGMTNFQAGEDLEPIYLREANFTKAAPPRPQVL